MFPPPLAAILMHAVPLYRTAILRRMRFHTMLVFILAVATAAVPALASPSAPAAPANFAPMQQWVQAVSSGDTAKITALYSTNPAAIVEAEDGSRGVAAESSFWASQHKSPSFRVRVDQSERAQSERAEAQAGLVQIVIRVEVPGLAGAKPRFVNEAFLWQQQGSAANPAWRIVQSRRFSPTRLRHPFSTSKDIYAAGHDAHTDVQLAIGRAARSGKNLLVVFGANWCYDCHVLDLAFEKGEVAEIVRQNFEVVHVDIGQGEKNQDLMQQYGVPMQRGIPAIAVLDGKGTLLTSQRSGEFAPARRLGPEDLEAFLLKWKPHH